VRLETGAAVTDSDIAVVRYDGDGRSFLLIVCCSPPHRLAGSPRCSSPARVQYLRNVEDALRFRSRSGISRASSSSAAA